MVTSISLIAVVIYTKTKKIHLGSSINGVTEFLIIFNTPSAIVTPFRAKASLLLSKNP